MMSKKRGSCQNFLSQNLRILFFLNQAGLSFLHKEQRIFLPSCAHFLLHNLPYHHFILSCKGNMINNLRIAKGASLDKMLAELFGKKTGYCQGKGGSMHIADVAGLHSLGANGIVGAGIPIAAGSALVSKIKGDKHVTLCFFGDSASNQGTFHEAVNMAAAWKLPVVFLCENNSYGVSVNIHSVTNTDTIAVRAQAYNIPGKTVDGNDPVTVYEAVKEAVDYAREGNGPSIVECMTFRHQGHYCGDPANYRPASYMEEAHKKDAIPNMRKRLLDGVATEEEILAVEKAVEDEMEAAYQFANESAYPDPSEATTDVYFSDNERSVVR